MGYWIEGSLEGEVLLDFTVEFLVKGVENNYHGDDWFTDVLEYSDTFDEVDPDIPHTWLSGRDRTIKEVRLVCEDPEPEDGEEEYEADYRVVIEFLEVSVPFHLEGWSEKITCAEDNLGHSINMRKILADLNRESPRSVKGLRVTDARIEAEFTGEGEDGEKVDMKLSSWAPCVGLGWGR